MQSSFHRPQSNSVCSIVFSSTIVCSNRVTTDWSFVLSKPFASRFLRCRCRWFLPSSFTSFEEEDEEEIPNASNSSLLSKSFVTSSDFELEEEEADACEFARVRRRRRFVLLARFRPPRTLRVVLHPNLGSTKTSKRTVLLVLILKVRTFSPKISISIPLRSREVKKSRRQRGANRIRAPTFFLSFSLSKGSLVVGDRLRFERRERERDKSSWCSFFP